METPSSIHTKAIQKKQFDVAYNKTSLYTEPVSSYDPATDKITYNGRKGVRTVSAYHPVITNSSWIRAAPDGGVALFDIDSGTGEEIAIGSHSPGLENYIRKYKNQTGVNVIRPLNAGEIEIHSKGLAQTFYSKEPILEHSAGIIRSWHDQKRLQYGVKAPLHVRVLHTKEAGEINVEERFGLVMRHQDNNLLFEEPQLLSDGVTYGKEYLRMFKSTLFPLEELKVGNVLAADGSEESSFKNNNLRYKHILYTDTGAEIKHTVDEKGNIYFATPVTTKEIKIVNSGETINISTQKDLKIKTVEGSFDANISKYFKVLCEQFKIGKADQRAALGDDLKSFLLQMLDVWISQTSIGNLGSPTPLSPDTISAINNLKAQYLNNDKILSDYIKFSKQP